MRKWVLNKTVLIVIKYYTYLFKKRRKRCNTYGALNAHVYLFSVHFTPGRNFAQIKTDKCNFINIKYVLNNTVGFVI